MTISLPRVRRKDPWLCTLRRTLGIFVLILSPSPWSGPRLAADDSEIALLHRIPAEVLDRIAFDAAPDSSGNMQLNKERWTSVVFQRVAMPLMWVGAAESNQQKVDQAWSAVDAALRPPESPMEALKPRAATRPRPRTWHSGSKPFRTVSSCFRKAHWPRPINRA